MIYTSRLFDAAELYLIELMTGDAHLATGVLEREFEDTLISAAMSVVSNSPWGGYPPPPSTVVFGSDLEVEDDEEDESTQDSH